MRAADGHETHANGLGLTQDCVGRFARPILSVNPQKNGCIDDKRHTLGYSHPLKHFQWSTEKNEHLIAERGVSFEEVVSAIEHGGLLDVRQHPNAHRYPHQKLLLVEIDSYVYLVPVVEESTHYFMKTIIPSRKATLELRDRKGKNDTTQ
jgi:uncharacterized DUF497 family protein